MTPISSIHPVRNLEPGRYMLDEVGMLWPALSSVPFRMVAAVVVLAPGELTRRQRAEQPTKPTRTDDVRAACAAEAAVREARFREAKRLTVAHPSEVTQRRPEAPLRSLARREKPRAVPGVENMIEQPDGDDEFIRQLQTRVVAKQAQRTKRTPMKAEPAIDGGRIAAAYRAKASAPRRQPKVPTRHALSREACVNCGIPGSRGCDHFLPFVEDAG